MVLRGFERRRLGSPTCVITEIASALTSVIVSTPGIQGRFIADAIRLVGTPLVGVS
jgi:hypothetical protein